MEVDVCRSMAKSIIASSENADSAQCFGADFDTSQVKSQHALRALDIEAENVLLTTRTRFLLRCGSWTNEVRLPLRTLSRRFDSSTVCNWLSPDPAVPCLCVPDGQHTAQQDLGGTRSMWDKSVSESRVDASTWVASHSASVRIASEIYAPDSCPCVVKSQRQCGRLQFCLALACMLRWMSISCYVSAIASIVGHRKLHLSSTSMPRHGVAVEGAHASLPLCGPSDSGCQDAEGNYADSERTRSQRDVATDMELGIWARSASFRRRFVL